MIGMGQFVQNEVGHPSLIDVKNPNIREFHAAGHLWIPIVFAQPTRIGMIFSRGARFGIFSREPERNFFQFRHRRNGNNAFDFLQL